jgi:DNA-binding transcriptional ArsR family regulator
MITISDDRNQATDAILGALADPTRRRIVELLGEAPRRASDLHRAFPIAAPAVSRHLRVLREAGLIADRGVPGDKRVRVYVLEPRALEPLADWLAQRSRAWQLQLDSFKDYVALRTVGDDAK